MPLYRFLAYLTILSIATYPIPELRIATIIMLPLYVPLIGGMTFLWLIMLLGKGRGISYPFQLRVALTLLVLGLMGSLLVAEEVDLGLVSRYLLFFLTPFLFAQAVRDRGSLERATWCLFLACVAVTIYGYYGFISGMVGQPAEHALGYWGIRYLPASRNSDVLYPAVGLMLSIVLFVREIARRSIFSGIILVPMVGMTLAVVLSQSRGGWLAVLLGLGVILLPAMKRAARPFPLMSRAIVLAAILTICAVVFLVPARYQGLLRERLYSWGFSNPAVSNQERVLVFFSVVRLVPLVPLGVGPGQIGSYLREREFGTAWAENSYLNVTIELGWIAGFAFLLYVSYPIRALRRQLSLTPQIATVYTLGYYGISIVLMVYLFFNVEVVSMFYWVISSLSVTAVRLVKEERIRYSALLEAVSSGSIG